MPFTPMLLVRDVEASSAWLRRILPLTSAHGGREFEMLADESGAIIAWLHTVDPTHEHPQFAHMDQNNFTGGTVFYFESKDLVAIYEKAVAAGATIVEPVHENPLARFSEFTFQDPNGYLFAVHSPSSF